MNVPLIVAGSLALLGAAVHGVGGEVLVVRKLSLGTLPSSSFGGPRTTKAMIHVTWHMTTVAFVTVGVALLLAGSVLHGDTAQGIADEGVGALGWALLDEDPERVAAALGEAAAEGADLEQLARA